MPSTRFLARALVKPLRDRRLPGRILEVGPGTGSVTREIARRMLSGDRLDAVEINARFIELLRRRMDADVSFWHAADRIRLICSAVEDLPGESMYDYIISGLPVNNFPVDQVREIFATYRRLLKPGGMLSYYEYALLRQLKTPFVNRRERRRLFRIGRVMRTYVRDYQVRRERIFINVPPATVRHLQLKPTSAVKSRAAVLHVT